MKLSLADVRSSLAIYGYTLTNRDGELEARPKGTPRGGTLAVFETDDEDGRASLIASVRASALSAFTGRLTVLPITDETRAALATWYAYHGEAWMDALSNAWSSGVYDGFRNDWNLAGTLQRLRNTNGHEVLALMTGITPYYLNRKGKGGAETVGEFDTCADAKAERDERKLSDPVTRLYVSRRPCANWQD